MNDKFRKIGEEIAELTLLETSDLVKFLEQKLGVSAAAPVSVVAPSVAASSEEEEEKTEFDVTLVKGGAEAIKVIKELRALTNLPLKEAKDAVDGGNFVVKTGVPKAEAEEIKKKLESAGATVTIS